LSAALISLGVSPALAASPDGAAIFAEKCTRCHQANAAGADGLAPSLAGTLADYAKSADGRQYLSQILISGMAGRIESQGRTIVGLMPRFANDLDDAQISATLNYVLATFNGVSSSPVTAAAVADARQRAPSPNETRKLREKIKAASP
jgi:mono/diheme cytochrome c family protein